MQEDYNEWAKSGAYSPPTPEQSQQPQKEYSEWANSGAYAAPEQVRTKPEVGDEDLITSLGQSFENLYTMGGDMSRMFLQGFTLNTYNDGKAWLSSKLMDSGAVDKPQGAQNLSGEALYKYILKGEQKATQEGRERSPYATAGAEVAGGFLTPNPAGKLQTASVGFRAAKSAVEGGIAGYFAEDVDNREMGDAAVGSAIGLGFQGSIEGLSWLVGAATSRKIAKDLVDQETGEFTPITLAADRDNVTEDRLGTFYSELVAPSFGAQRNIRKQEQNIILPYKERMELAEEEIRRASPKVNKRIAELTAKQEAFFTKYKARRKALQAEGTGDAEQAIEALDLQYSKDVRELSVNAENAVKAAEDSFRLATMTASLPTAVNNKFLPALAQAANPNMALKMLDEQWKTNGFSMVNDRSFRISKKAFDPESFQDSLKDFAPDVRDKMMPLVRIANEELGSVVNRELLAERT